MRRYLAPLSQGNDVNLPFILISLAFDGVQTSFLRIRNVGITCKTSVLQSKCWRDFLMRWQILKMEESKSLNCFFVVFWCVRIEIDQL